MNLKMCFVSVILLLIFISAKAQSIVGRYVGEDGYVEIFNDSVLIYNIKIHGCLTMTEAAYAHYKIFKDSIIQVYPIQNDTFENSMKKISQFIHVTAYFDETYFFKFSKQRTVIRGKYFNQPKRIWIQKLKLKRHKDIHVHSLRVSEFKKE